MADVTGLLALRYALPPGADATALLAPPYDVLDAAGRARLAARSEHNAVHVDLVADGDYDAAAARFKAWRRDGVLVQDARPAITLTEQRFVGPDGVARVRRGLIAGVALEPFDRGVILPHEHTLRGPKVDRLRLFEALGATASQVFGVYEAGDGPGLDALWTDLGTPLFEARSDDGVHHTAWRVDDPERLALVHRFFAQRPVLIADGHHRYETHLAYAEAQRRALGRQDVPAGRVAMYLAALDDPGTRVYPIHRLVRDLPGFDRARFLEAVAARLETRVLPAGLSLPELDEAVGHGLFALVFPDGSATLCSRRADAQQDDGDVLASFPAARLHRDVLEEVCGITAELLAAEAHVDFVKQPAELLDRLAEGRHHFAVVLPPADLSVVLAAARAGVRMPQKSTFFFPKILTGVVFSVLDGETRVASPGAEG